MRGWNSNKWGFWNKIFAGLCVVLALALAVFLFWYMRSERRMCRRLSVRPWQQRLRRKRTVAVSLRQRTAANHRRKAAVNHRQKIPQVRRPEMAQPASRPGRRLPVQQQRIRRRMRPVRILSQAETDPVDSGETAASTDITGISWRGDEFLSGSDIEEKGAAALLEQRLADAGYHIQVENFSLTGAGTLSQLRLAGVSERDIQWYVEDHKEKESSAQTETGVREFSDEELAGPTRVFSDYLYGILWRMEQRSPGIG